MIPSRNDLYRLNRRAFLGRHAGALGTLALAHLLDEERPRQRASATELDIPRPALVARTPKARAKSVICLFQHGGPSQMDLFDPKPMLTRFHGKPYPGTLEVHFNNQAGNLLLHRFASAHRANRASCSASFCPRSPASSTTPR